MAFFKRDKPEFKSTEWQALSESDLKDRVAPLLAFLATALHGTLGLVVSPGSRESKKYAHEVDDAVRRLTESPPKAGSIESSRLSYSEASVEFGEWQRDQVDSFKTEVAEAVDGIVCSAKGSFVGQEDTLSGLEAIGRNLRTASDSDDIRLMRATLKQEAEKARELFVRQRSAHQELQDEFDESIRHLEDKLTAVEGAGSKDYLTECASRASLDFYITAICRKAQVESKHYSLAMLDLDDFKGVNDVWGHQVGDRALSHLVRALKQEFPTRAFIGRYGGDEFVVVATMSCDELAKRMERLIRALRKNKIKMRDGEADITLSVSAGVTQIGGRDHMEKVIGRADEALYEAKSQGKGRVMEVKKDAA